MRTPRSALLSMIVVCVAGILAIILFVRPGRSPEGDAPPAVHDVRQHNSGARTARPDEDPILDSSEDSPSARIEAVPIEAKDTLLSRLLELQSLPEGSLEEITAKHDAIQAVLSEPRPKKNVIQIKPGVDWKAERRAQNPELACVGDDLFRLKKAIREMRYAEYLSSQEPAPGR
jgi:hypothetical protein